MTTLSALAPAQVNLFLHVGPVDDEGYHPICSLVAFADLGDRLHARLSDRLTLKIEGSFSAGLEGTADNLILRALRNLPGNARIEMVLDKALPVASGLGGGSSDAGAALRLAAALSPGVWSEADLERGVASVGADGPMCLAAVSAWAEGRGERLTPEPRLPPLHAVLVNPRAPSSTGAVYRAYDAGPVAESNRPAPPDDWSAATVIRWLAEQRNDLEAPALTLQPAIGPVIDALAATEQMGLTRMSGSGATAFALYAEADAAKAASERLARDHGDWWVRQTVLGLPVASPA